MWCGIAVACLRAAQGHAVVPGLACGRLSLACGVVRAWGRSYGAGLVVGMVRIGCRAIGRVAGMPAGRFWVLAGRRPSSAGAVGVARGFLARRAAGPVRIE